MLKEKKPPQPQKVLKRIKNYFEEIIKVFFSHEGKKTTAGKQEVKKALRSIIWIKYKLKNKEVFDKAYSYIEQYY